MSMPVGARVLFRLVFGSWARARIRRRSPSCNMVLDTFFSARSASYLEAGNRRRSTVFPVGWDVVASKLGWDGWLCLARQE